MFRFLRQTREKKRVLCYQEHSWQHLQGGTPTSSVCWMFVKGEYCETSCRKTRLSRVWRCVYCPSSPAVCQSACERCRSLLYTVWAVGCGCGAVSCGCGSCGAVGCGLWLWELWAVGCVLKRSLTHNSRR